MESESFALVWQAYQAGDAEAKNRILAAFIPRIGGLIRKYLRNPENREDVEQSVLVSFLANHGAKVNQIGERHELWQLFAEITLRHCSKHNKRIWRALLGGLHVRIGGGDSQEGRGGYTPVDTEVSPDEQVAMADLIAEANNHLTPRQQKILAGLLEGRRRKQLGEALKVSIATVDRELADIKTILARLAGADQRSASP